MPQHEQPDYNRYSDISLQQLNQSSGLWQAVSQFRGPELGMTLLTLIVTSCDLTQICQAVALIGIIILGVISRLNGKTSRAENRSKTSKSQNESRYA